ncbi:MAG: DNA repair protein RadC [Symbiobacteriaceae bacterium]|nr:DNA repair protein RadC [Symbiobacteriaceae bacterium]
MPREKLIAYGADHLSDAELLSLILRTGYAGKAVLDWSQELLQRHGGWSGLAQLTAEDFLNRKNPERGFGEAKTAELLAVIEIGRRIARGRLEQASLTTPDDAANLLYSIFKGVNQECFSVLSLSVRSRLIKADTVFVGTIDHALVQPREVFAYALRRGAAKIIVAHNHPSGDPTPSRDDEVVTLRLSEAGKLMGIDLLDHIIIGDGAYTSLKSQGVF